MVNEANKQALGADAAALLDNAVAASLSTISAKSIGKADVGVPYGSLVLIGQDPADGAPILLLSDLARHTQNLLADPNGSLLLAQPPKDAQSALEAARLTLMGRFLQLRGESLTDSVRAAYLTRHPDAEIYADFADFSFWKLQVLGAHLVAGFGKITEIPVNSLIYKRF